jgi:hypothetical protein
MLIAHPTLWRRRLLQFAPRHWFDLDLGFMLTSLGEVVSHLEPQQVSASPPNALASRIAISADIPLPPFTRLI